MRIQNLKNVASPKKGACNIPRLASVFYDKRAGCWATNSLKPMRHTKTGRSYRPRSYARDLTDPKKDRREAERWLRDQLELIESQYETTTDPTLYHVSEWYLESAEKTLTRETYHNRHAMLRRVLHWPSPDHPQRLALVLAREFSKTHLNPFLQAMRDLGREPSYIEALLRAIKRMMAWTTEIDPGVYPGLPLHTNPIARVKGPSIKRRAHRDISSEAIQAMLAFLDQRWRNSTGLAHRFGRITTTLIRAGIATGARPKELCIAEWTELKTAPDGWSILTLPAWKHKTGRKTGKERHIAFPPEVTSEIEWIRSLPDHHERFIFTHRRGRGRGAIGTAEAGEPWAWVDHAAKQAGDTHTLQKAFQRLVIEARAAGVVLPEGYRLYWHRSSYSTEGQRRGVSRALLADAMGTSERMLEKHYSDMDSSDVLNTAKRVQGEPGKTKESPEL